MAFGFDVESLKHKATRQVVAWASGAVKNYLRAFGLFIAAPLVALMDVWDYLLKRDRITGEYSKEIGAQLGKDPESVTAEDMKTVAQENPTIAEALKRARRRRNLDIAVNVTCTIATFFIAAAIVPASPAIPILVLAGVLGFVGYQLGSFLLDKIGSKFLGLSEPSLKKVMENPALQNKLSVPSQVKFLERFQKDRKNITPRQITTLFEKAHQPVSPAYAAELAGKLNERKIDATELAFIVYGQASGVPERESPELSQLEIMNMALQKDLAIAKDKLRDASSAAKDKTAEFAGSVRDKSAEVGGKAGDLWQRTVRRNRNSQAESHTDAILAERELQAQSATPPL